MESPNLEIYCPCLSCITGNYRGCTEYLHVGEWVNYNGQDHINYESIPIKNKNPRKRRRGIQHFVILINLLEEYAMGYIILQSINNGYNNHKYSLV